MTKLCCSAMNDQILFFVAIFFGQVTEYTTRRFGRRANQIVIPPGTPEMVHGALRR